MNKITFCIPSKNNLRYLKNSIKSIKENSAIEHHIIVYADMDEDGTERWLIENGIQYLKNDLNKPQGIAHAYNKCIEMATTEIVCMFHADMYMARGFDENILKFLKRGSVVAGTRIEPPLHPEGKEKIVKNFGLYPEDFKKEEFDEFVRELIAKNQNVTTKGIFAPWACYKEDITKIGMHDETFHSYHEDSDIFNRFILNGYDITQIWTAFVYHLTCRGGQFQDGIEQVTKDVDFHNMKQSAARNYLRKWGSWIKNDEYQYPIIPHKYGVGLVVKNCNLDLLRALEPWCDKIYIEDGYGMITTNYIEEEQKNTKFDLSRRIRLINHHDPICENDIVVEFDGTMLNQNNFIFIERLSEILTENEISVGYYEMDIFKFHISSVRHYENDLIKIVNNYA